MSRKRLHPVGNTQRLRILKRDNYTCQYCFEGATEVDHILPHSYKADNADANLVASCGECNRLASNMVFPSFIMKYQYIKRRRQQRGNRRGNLVIVPPPVIDEAPKPEKAKAVKPPKPKVVKPPKVKVEKPPKIKVVKPPRARVERTPRIVEPLKVIVDAAMFLGYCGPAMTVLIKDADGKESYTFGVPWENLPKFIQDRIADKYFKSE